MRTFEAVNVQDQLANVLVNDDDLRGLVSDNLSQCACYILVLEFCLFVNLESVSICTLCSLKTRCTVKCRFFQFVSTAFCIFSFLLVCVSVSVTYSSEPESANAFTNAAISHSLTENEGGKLKIRRR